MDISKLSTLARQVESPFTDLAMKVGRLEVIHGAAARVANDALAPYAAGRSALEAAYQRSLPESMLVGRHIQDVLAQQMGIPTGVTVAAAAFESLGRTTRWASILGDMPALRIHELLPSASPIADEILRIQRIGSGIAEAASAVYASRVDLASMPGSHLSEALYTTRFKLSAFAGATDVLGPGAVASLVAFDSLLGRYHTSMDLPPAFWRNRDVRRRTYREAEVDDGLIDADPSETVEMFIDSGVAEAGRSRGARPVAVLHSGPVRVYIAASQPKVGAFRTIDAFEEYLRSFVALKMEMIAGEQWLKHRVQGDVFQAAKQRRRDALRRGEPHQPLIQFLHLGELCSIILRRDNWEAVFEEVFVRREHFQVDIDRLIAVRNPTDHARRIDAVQLSEVVLTTYNLRAHIDRDGPIDADWDADW